jgi:pimeloyl-ACP methyl ester carboxylesterase
VLLIPTVLFDLSMWWPVAADLRPHATVVAVDLPGHGTSRRRSRYDPHELVDDLAGLTAHLGLTQAPIVVGHGTAAGLAELFATRYATHAVVTVDATSQVPADHRQYLAGMAAETLPGPDRLLRLVRALPDPPIGDVAVLGVDDFAIKRGHHYGTVLIDCENRRVVDVLVGRDAEPLTAWLQECPNAAVICRDRASAYAAKAGLLEPQFLADGWSHPSEIDARSRRRVLLWLDGMAGATSGARSDAQ